MNRAEFTKAMLYLSAGCQRMLKDEQLEVYFDVLKDFSYDDFFAGVKGVLIAHVWATFPSVAELRQAASEVANWRHPRLTGGEAWALSHEAALDIDPDMQGPHRVYHGDGKFTEYASQAASVMDGMPPEVVNAMRVYGLHELCCGQEPTGVARAQFIKIFEQIAEREKRVALLPPSVREFLETKRDENLVQNALAGIGEMPK